MPRNSRLSLDVMETLLTVVECDGDAALAAERLGIHQPSMSKRLAQLQHKHSQMRFSWLYRDGKTWLLTDEGRRVLPAIREIVRLSRQVHDDLDARVDNTPSIAIACGQLAARTFVREALLQFRKQSPTVRVKLATPRGAARINGIETGLFDIAIVSHDEGDIQERYGRPLGVDHLFDDPWLLICGNRAAKDLRQRFEKLPAKVRPDQLLDLPLILPDRHAGLRKQLEKSLLARGHSPALRPLFEVGGWTTLIQFAQDGFGIGMVTANALHGVDKLLPAKPLDPRWVETPQLKLLYRLQPETQRSSLSDEAEQLCEWIATACANLAGSS